MRIISILLALLLSSPSVFAETYVCSFLINETNTIMTKTYRRTVDGFEFEGTGWNDIGIAFEDSEIIVLQMTNSAFDLHLTTIVQIVKDGSYFSYTELTSPDSVFNSIYTGTCTVVE